MFGRVALSLAGASAESGWDLSTAQYVRSFSVFSQDTSVDGVWFKPDGTVMYIVGSSSNKIHQYSLGTAWDVSTASLVQSASILTPSGMFMSEDGTKLYISRSGATYVTQYSLSTAWDVSTLSAGNSLNTSSYDAYPSDVFLHPDGTSAFVLGTQTDRLYAFSLSTPWDLSTASYSKDVLFGEDCTSVFFSDDGSRMYIILYSQDSVRQYSLGTPWDIDTLSSVYTYSVSSQESAPFGLYLGPDGANMYVVGISSDAVNQYSLE